MKFKYGDNVVSTKGFNRGRRGVIIFNIFRMLYLINANDDSSFFTFRFNIKNDANQDEGVKNGKK